MSVKMTCTVGTDECECEDDIWGQVSESVKMAFGDR